MNRPWFPSRGDVLRLTQDRWAVSIACSTVNPRSRARFSSVCGVMKAILHCIETLAKSSHFSQVIRLDAGSGRSTLLRISHKSTTRNGRGMEPARCRAASSNDLFTRLSVGGQFPQFPWIIDPLRLLDRLFPFREASSACLQPRRTFRRSLRSVRKARIRDSRGVDSSLPKH